MKLTKNQRAVLEVLADARGEVPGVEVANGFSDWSRAGAYLALAQLERLGLVTSRWDTERSKPRRLYRVSAHGSSVLMEQRERRMAAARNLSTEPSV